MPYFKHPQQGMVGINGSYKHNNLKIDPTTTIYSTQIILIY